VSADDERIKVYSPEVPLFSPLKFNIKSYYPEKGLEQKVDRAVIEYLGMLNDLNSLGC
jgi:hypothetical protein